VKFLKNVKLIHLFSAGADRLVGTPVWKATTIPITNSSGVHGPQISEWVVLQMLANNHKQKVLLEWQKKHYWGKHTEVGWVRDYVGQRLGVLGYGAIGRQSKLFLSSSAFMQISRMKILTRENQRHGFPNPWAWTS
jgi:phosphoglycerate dehydrogenase-like enzyme